MRTLRPTAAVPRGTPFRFIAAVLRAVTVICGVLMLQCADVTAADAAATAGTLQVAGWHISAWGEKVHGIACWIASADTALRLEMHTLGDAVEASSEAERQSGLNVLLSRRGDGWTYTRAGRDLPGLLNRWGERWRAVSPDLARLLQVISATLVAGPGVGEPHLRAAAAASRGDRPRASRWRATIPGRHGAQQPLLQLGGDLWLAEPGGESVDPPATDTSARWRRDLVARGRGRGGLAEVVTLFWVTPTDAAARPQLAVRSLRRPGTLYLWALAAEPVRYPQFETFLPIWSLQQLLDR